MCNVLCVVEYADTTLLRYLRWVAIGKPCGVARVYNRFVVLGVLSCVYVHLCNKSIV